MTVLAHVASRIFNTPLLIHPDKAQAILWALGARIGVDAGAETPKIDANRFLGEARPDTGHKFRQAGDAAIISITGTLINRGAFVGSQSGEQSYEGINAQIKAALADSHVERIVLDIDSPGGEAGGMAGMAAAIRKANTVKPVVAVVNDLAASAAYGLASAAGRIVVSPTSTVGSIGVVLVHLDQSDRLSRMGLNATLIHAGARKVDGNPFQPLSDDALTNMASRVEQIYGLFINEVVQGRAGLSAEHIRDMQANEFLGQTAIDMGLADEIGCCEDVIAERSATTRNHLIAAASPGERYVSGPLKEFPVGLAGHGDEQEQGPATATGPANEGMETMTDKATGSAVKTEEPTKVTLESIDTDYPDIAKALREQGAQAEHDRIKAIDDLALPGHEQLVADMKADQSVTPEAASRRLIKAEQVARNETMKALAESDIAAVQAAPAATEAKPEAKTGEEAWQDEWDRDESVRTEFCGDFNRFKAFKQAETAGRVKRLRKA